MVKLTHNGMTKSLKEWSDYLGVPYATISTRYLRGWPVDKILTKSNYHMRRRKPKAKVPTCGYPECFTCEYDDCINNSAPRPNETQIVKDAMKRLPDSENRFEHQHALNRGKYYG